MRRGLATVADTVAYKMALCVRADLKLGKGKIASQCAHAAVSAFKKASTSNPVAVRAWEHDGQAKVVLRVADAAELYVALQKPGEQEQERDCLDGEDDGEAMLWEAANTTQLPFPPFNPPFPPRFAVQQRAQEARLVTAVIRDAGHTQIDPGTVTVLAVGPERADRVDGVTGKLKLL